MLKDPEDAANKIRVTGEGIPIAAPIRWKRGRPHGGTSNIEHPTPNIEWQRESSLISAYGVRCFPSVQGFQRANFHFGEISLRSCLAGRRSAASAMVVVSRCARPFGEWLARTRCRA